MAASVADVIGRGRIGRSALHGASALYLYLPVNGLLLLRESNREDTI